MNILKKLTSRKFWMAVAAFVVGVLALFSVDGNTVAQISGVIMSLGAVIAYIVGEGLVDSAAAGAATVISGNPAITGVPEYSAPVIGTVDSSPEGAAPTGVDQAAQVKQDTALSGTGTVNIEDVAKVLTDALNQQAQNGSAQ